MKKNIKFSKDKIRIRLNNNFLKREATKKSPLFIIASGPSIANQDISKLKDCYTMSFNRSYIAFQEWGFEPTYFAGLDHVVNKDNKKEFHNLIFNSKIQRFFFPDDPIARKYFESEKTSIIQIEGNNPENVNLNFKTKLTVANSGLFGLQIAIGLLGFKEIFLLGCDATYQESVKGVQVKNGLYVSNSNTDTNHFRNDYYGKGTTYNKPNSEKWHYPAWKTFFNRYIRNNKKGINVYNCSSTGRLTFFEYKDFDNIVKNIKIYEITG